MKRLVIFGTGQIGQVAHYYFTEDSEYDVMSRSGAFARTPRNSSSRCHLQKEPHKISADLLIVE
jgi:saccharopine dehydrogenase-like NADP-dependent oxidoreductase